MKLTIQNFKKVAENRNEVSFSDDELLEMIEVTKCLHAYFKERKEHILSWHFTQELMHLESFATARGWKEEDGHWKINKTTERAAEELRINFVP